MTTFLIIEHDIYNENPFIYVKLLRHAPLLLLSDSGCGTTMKDLTLRSLIETRPVASNGNRPLNPRNALTGQPEREYLVVSTHCHYDHILGLDQFADAIIVASQHGQKFVESDLPEHSLCNYLGIPTPDYKVSWWAQDGEELSFRGRPLGITILNTPGHIPDELAWWDEEERHLYVGDSFYERKRPAQKSIDGTFWQLLDADDGAAIIFPKEGDLVAYIRSMERLQSFVQQKNIQSLVGRRALVGCGHITAAVDAEETLTQIIKLFSGILEGSVPILRSEHRRGEVYDLWQENCTEPRFSVFMPRRLVEAARKQLCAGRPQGISNGRPQRLC